ncbi:nuclear transport factor 2 family protein [Pseudoduganella buxea]|uniref:DUF4440 domain-containing protein n=1 Tax=Pseudoduganella buxea TaxID=1949069 RepID=A0A6I3SZ29_9BURK|nr:nuclear transport factor 2 family protein [Pseudoduganella buxea]MTV54540.1 DUF4440 domain-containing protein [Pseudoduganella buxea]GGB83004.1 hypothetical protein GCM10011572_01160 [Pseudoduganella buxea]
MKVLAAVLVFFVVQSLGCHAAAAQSSTTRNAPARSATESALMALEKQRADAIVQRDIPALQRLMDRYYRHVESRGRVRSKTELLTALERGDFRFQTYYNDTAEIQLLDGGKTAIVAGEFHSQEEGRKVFHGRYVRIWVLQRDGWKNTFHQGTEIRAAADRSSCD